MNTTYAELGLMRVEINELKQEIRGIHQYHKRRFWLTIGILIGSLGIQAYTNLLF